MHHACVALLALLAGLPALASAAFPIEFTGQMCTAQSVCTPLSFVVQPNGVLSYTGTIGGLTAHGSGTWLVSGKRVLVDDGSRMSFSGPKNPTCYRGSGTFLGTPVRFEVCR